MRLWRCMVIRWWPVFLSIVCSSARTKTLINTRVPCSRMWTSWKGACLRPVCTDEKELYPEPQEYRVLPPHDLVIFSKASFAQGFFQGVHGGVKTVLLRTAQSCGIWQKDYQQLMIIRSMCRQLALLVEIIAAETVRDTDGLALSRATNICPLMRRRSTAPVPCAASGA